MFERLVDNGSERFIAARPSRDFSKHFTSRGRGPSSPQIETALRCSAHYFGISLVENEAGKRKNRRGHVA